MSFLNVPMYHMFIWIYNTITHDYFLTIVLATLALKLVTLPFDIKSRRESQKMSTIQTDLKLLQKKYKDDQQKLQMKTSQLYKEKGINPYASCLPMLITLPVLFAFFGGCRLWADEIAIKTALEVSNGNLAYLTQFKWLWINNIFQPDSGIASVVPSLKQFAALLADKQIVRFANIIPSDVLNAAKALVDNYEALVLAPAKAFVTSNAPAFLQNMVKAGSSVANGWFILPLLAGGSMILQMKIASKNAPQPEGMGKTMNIMFAAMAVYFCLTSSSIFAVYWIASNVIAILSQFLINKLIKADANKSTVIEGEGTIK